MVGKAMLISCDEHDAQVTGLDAGWFGPGRRVGAVLIGAADDLYRCDASSVFNEPKES